MVKRCLMMRVFGTAAVALSCAAPSSFALSSPVEKDVTVLSFKLHYLEAGSGAPVVLLHGLGGDGSRWGPNVEALSREFRVLALDEIGFGKSDKPLANYHTGMLSEFLVGFLDALGIEKASLVGNSMGAAVAAYTAVHYPSRVAAIVLVDGAGYRRDPESEPPPADLHRRQIQNGVTREETREFFRIMFHDKSLVTDRMVEDNLVLRLRSAFTIGKIQETGEKGIGGITEEEMRSIRAPTLVIWGKYDELASPDNADRLHRDIPGSKLVWIDDAGHLPQLEKPAEFNRVVADFLRSPR
jgi:pimeloyl-ACP methyl ester carboxylesterase